MKISPKNCVWGHVSVANVMGVEDEWEEWARHRDLNYSWVFDRFFRNRKINRRRFTPRLVNGGYCFVWAWIAHRLKERAYGTNSVASTVLCTIEVLTPYSRLGSHAALITDRSDVLDAEMPGDFDWMWDLEDIPFVRRWRRSNGASRPFLRRMEPKEFKKWWAGDDDAFAAIGLKPWPKL